jgi:enediyne biosynthesis protein E4
MVVQFLLTFWLVANSASAAFVDTTATPKIGFVFEASKTPTKYLIEAMGGGVAMIDADGDGNLDLFFVNGATLKIGMNAKDRADKTDTRYWNRLYRNEGDGTFSDITEKAELRGNGYGQGVAVGDCDNDGRADLFVTALGRERQVKLLKIRWPSGVVQTWKNMAANQIFVAKEAAQ